MKYIRNRGSLGLLPQLPVTGALSSFGVRTGRDRAVLGNLNQAERKDWLSGFSYRKSFTYSRASGAVENYQVKLAIGESSGVNLLTNPGFEDTTDPWYIWQCTQAIVSGGQSGTCMEITRTTGDFQQTRQDVSLEVGGRYVVTAYAKSGTSGNEEARLYANTTEFPWDWSFGDSLTTSSEWQQLSVEFTAPAPTAEITLQKNTATAGTMLFDTVVLQPAIHCNAHCLSTFNDLRFTKSDGTTELDYWIESISGTTPNQIATVWVELDSVGTSATTFYMYYGKADAASASSGANTFILFDDFERGEAGDPIGGDWTLDSGNATISEYRYYTGTRSAVFVGGATVAQLSIPLTAASGEYAIGMWAYKTSYGDFAPVRHGNGSKAIAIILGDSPDWLYWNGSTLVNLLVDGESDAWFYVELANIDFSAGTVDLYYNGSLLKEDVPMYSSSASQDVATIRGANNSGKNDYVDLFRVRNWRSPEPALGSWGSEESA